MNFQSAIKLVALAATIAVVSLARSPAAHACDPSGWFGVVEPFLRCLEVQSSQTDDHGMDIHNACEGELEITPADCEAPCSQTVLLVPDATAPLALSDTDRDGDKRVFNYKMLDQTGTLTFTNELNPCDEEGGCSVGRASRSRSPRLGDVLVLLALSAQFVRARRRVSH